MGENQSDFCEASGFCARLKASLSAQYSRLAATRELMVGTPHSVARPTAPPAMLATIAAQPMVGVSFGNWPVRRLVQDFAAAAQQIIVHQHDADNRREDYVNQKSTKRSRMPSTDSVVPRIPITSVV